MISHVTRLYRLSITLPFLCLILIFPALVPLPAQSTGSVLDSLLPGRKPSDATLQWKEIVGIYGPVKTQIIIFERNAKLFWSAPDQNLSRHEWPLDLEGDQLLVPTQSGSRVRGMLFRDSSGAVTLINVGDTGYLKRADAGSDPTRFYHVTPVQPVAELREKALKLSPPAEQGSFQKAVLVELAGLDPLIHLDIRYASPNNFLSTPVYTQARAFMQRPAAEALVHVLHKLQPLGYGLLIHDAYRPWYVTKIFWDATPPEGKIFVANPKEGSKHNRGCAVDLTLYDLASGNAIEMPGLYDEMSPRSFPNFSGGTSLQRWHRDLLRRAMESEGFTVNEDEWWHFDYKDWKQYGILNVPFEKLGIAEQPITESH